MAITTYAELQAALGTWSFNRTDIPATDCIALAEGAMRADTALIFRTEEADNPLSGAQGSRTIALPANFVRPITLWRLLTDLSRDDPLQLIPAGDMQAVTVQGIPRYWAIDGTNLVFERPLDAAYSFVLRCETNLATLSVSNTSNFLLATYPQLYLAASLLQAALWLQDAEQAATWQAAYERAKADVSSAESKAKGSPPLRTEAADVFRSGYGYNIYSGQ